MVWLVLGFWRGRLILFSSYRKKFTIRKLIINNESVFHALKPTENIFFNDFSGNVWQHFIRFLIFCFIQFLNKIDRDYSDFKENFWISFLPFKNQRRFFFKPDLPVIIWRRRTFTKHLCLNQFKAKLTEN